MRSALCRETLALERASTDSLSLFATAYTTTKLQFTRQRIKESLFFPVQWVGGWANNLAVQRGEDPSNRLTRTMSERSRATDATSMQRLKNAARTNNHDDGEQRTRVKAAVGKACYLLDGRHCMPHQVRHPIDVRVPWDVSSVHNNNPSSALNCKRVVFCTCLMHMYMHVCVYVCVCPLISGIGFH